MCTLPAQRSTQEGKREGNEWTGGGCRFSWPVRLESGDYEDGGGSSMTACGQSGEIRPVVMTGFDRLSLAKKTGSTSLHQAGRVRGRDRHARWRTCLPALCFSRPQHPRFPLSDWSGHCDAMTTGMTMEFGGFFFLPISMLHTVIIYVNVAERCSPESVVLS